MAPITFSLIFRWNVNWNVPDVCLLGMLDLLDDVREQAFFILPLMVLYAKIIPRKNEATTFAMLTGADNLFRSLAAIEGMWVNDLYVGVTKESQTHYWVLQAVCYLSSLLPLFFLYYLPSQKQINLCQERLREQHEKEKANLK